MNAERQASGKASRRFRWWVVGAAVGLAGAALAAAYAPPIRQWIVAVMTPTYVHVERSLVRRGASGDAPRGLDWVQVARGLSKPTDLQFVPGGGGLALALEQGGKVRLLDLSRAADRAAPPAEPSATVLDLAVRTDSELGLLGLAFHPRYRDNGLVYVNSTPAGGTMRTRIAEWRLAPAELGKVPAHDERVILEVDQPYPNHNAGQLAFGPDGLLYVGFGDGGWRGDPHGNAQNPKVLLGKMLRIDVDGRSAGAYAIPPDNPFVGKAGVRPEIWATGLRNPWRYSFDPHGRLIVADVGQDRFEEIDLVARGDDLGWNAREATHCFEPKEGCRTEGFVEPIFEYGRETGSCVTGGYVYTGSSIAELRGRYVFADFVSGVVFALPLPNPDIPEKGLREGKKLGVWPMLVSSFGRDEQGELYAVDYGQGGVYRLVAGSSPSHR